MNNGRQTPAMETAADSSSSAFSFISKGWREVRDSADADLRLMKDRANSFKNIAASFDREIENLIYSATPTFTVPPIRQSSEIEFMKKLHPKMSEFRRVYSAPEISRKVMEKCGPRANLGIELSRIRSTIAAEVFGTVEEDMKGIIEFNKVRSEKLNEEGQFGEWEPIRVLKTRFREFEKKNSTVEIFAGFKKNEFVEKVKSSLKAICKEPQESKEVPPLDVPELLAVLVRQSGPFLDQFGIRRNLCDKIVENLCSKWKNQLVLRSLVAGEPPAVDPDKISDELDLRIASVLQSTGHCSERGGSWTDFMKPDVTDGKRSDQELVYPNNLTFGSPEEQENYIRNWLEESVGFKADFRISFYPGKFSRERRSIIPAGDTSQFIPSKNADIAILEEPEHLNWYHHGKRWTDKFNHVVGIVHTNYLEYIKREKNGALQAFFVKHINNLVTRAHCHRVLRLSAATQDMPKSVICNVHGVNPKFLKIGEKVAAERELGQQAFSKGAYFLGKMVWAKGYKELIDLLAKHKNDLNGFKLDVYGNGEDAHEVQSTAKRLDLNLNFQKGRDHADDSLQGYKVFINPSVSDVLCTATAEALAMGKFVVCADHPSNEFFSSFPNCLTYKTPEDFVAKVKEALANEPQPLTPEQRYNLSWEAATKRFIEYSELDRILNNEYSATTIRKSNGKAIARSVSMPTLSEMVDGGIAFAHYCLTGNEFLRLCTGAIPGTRDYGRQHCKDLHLLPPQVESPIYGCYL
ncbi:hypothetical protein V6Z12_D11G384200 [Gossypium hirsutum]